MGVQIRGKLGQLESGKVHLYVSSECRLKFSNRGRYLHFELVIDTGTGNPPGTRIRVSRVRVQIPFLVSVAVPIPATAGFL
jgi:coproporphyrinogen III oxidase